MAFVLLKRMRQVRQPLHSGMALYSAPSGPNAFLHFRQESHIDADVISFNTILNVLAEVPAARACCVLPLQDTSARPQMD